MIYLYSWRYYMMYDVIIVGAGPAGLFSAYELVKKNKDLKVLLIDRENG